MKHVFTFAFLLAALGLSAQGSKFDYTGFAGLRDGVATANPKWAPFYHGVASGDPLEDRVIIWTRVTPEGMGTGPIEVEWQVATEPSFMENVASGTFTTDADRDYTVKVDVTGLEPGQTYYYVFTYEGAASLIGRTKTLPVGEVDNLKFVVVSCSNYQAGYFNAYKRISERNDLDAVIHLGDYIYEYEEGGYGIDSLFAKRRLEPDTEILTLEDYRTRYSLYRLDTMLARVHQQHPFITVWDDHESANDAWTGGAENHNEIVSLDSIFDGNDMFVGFDTTFADEGPWEERLAIAKQVYFEWMPIRDTPDRGVYRKFSYGNLADLIMLDTRIEGREQQILNIYDPELQSPDRTILGEEQKAWLKEQLSGSSAQWKLIGQQVTMAPFNIGFAGPPNGAPFEAAEALFLDFWDGYPAERVEIFDYIESNAIDNVVVLTGDVHTAFVYDLTKLPAELQFTTNDTTGLIESFQYLPSDSYDPATGEGSVAVEFVTPSINSANFDENLGPQGAQVLSLILNSAFGGFGNPNPHMKWKELVRHGYFVIDVTPERAQADYFFGPIRMITGDEEFTQAWLTNDGDNHLSAASGPAPPKEVQDEPAPLDPPSTTSSTREAEDNVAIIGVYPNPFRSESTIQFSLSEASRVRVELLQASGQLIRVLTDEELSAGTHQLTSNLGDLVDGPYIYQVKTDKGVRQVEVVMKK